VTVEEEPRASNFGVPKDVLERVSDLVGPILVDDYCEILGQVVVVVEQHRLSGHLVEEQHELSGLVVEEQHELPGQMVEEEYKLPGRVVEEEQHNISGQRTIFG
jgi:hypothetical protein